MQGKVKAFIPNFSDTVLPQRHASRRIQLLNIGSSVRGIYRDRCGAEDLYVGTIANAACRASANAARECRRIHAWGSIRMRDDAERVTARTYRSEAEISAGTVAKVHCVADSAPLWC